MHRICTFCGSRPRALTLYSEAAADFGTALAKRGITLVYGGGSAGLMGSVADAVLSAGGDVIGVIPDALTQREQAHLRLSQILLVPSLHERKRAMFDLSDAFVALPGGIGTMEQFVEVLSWATFGIHAKPIGLLNVNGYFDPMLRFLDRMVSDRFLGAAERSAILVETVAERLLDRLGTARPKVFEVVLTEAQI